MQGAKVPSENHGRKRALLIGVSTYNNEPSHIFCEKNGLDMYEIFRSDGYEIRDKIRLLGQVKHQQMRKDVIDFFGNSHSEDRIIFYYTGQVFLNAQGSVYLGSSEINPSIPFEGGMSFSDLINIVDRCLAKNKIIFLDCFIGSKAKLEDGKLDPNLELASSDIKRKSSNGHGKIFFACIQNNQEAQSLVKEGNSIFTYYLILGLQSGEKSKEASRYVTAQGLGNFVFEQLKSLPREKRPRISPIIMTHLLNDIIIITHGKQMKEEHEASWPDCNELSELRKYDEAIECYDNTIRMNPNNADAYNNKGTVLCELEKYDEAIECYDKALELGGNDDIVYYNKGNALCELRKYDEAIECYDKAIGINPNNADVHNNKAYALSKLLRMKEADESLNRARALTE